jgi:hypothetical protein
MKKQDAESKSLPVPICNNKREIRVVTRKRKDEVKREVEMSSTTSGAMTG